MLGHEVGGYDQKRGWTGNKQHQLGELAGPPRLSSIDDDPWTQDDRGWVPLATHLAETETEAQSLLRSLALPARVKDAVRDAARLHDIGKALPRWQEAILRGIPGVEGPVAKSPALWSCTTPVNWTEDDLRKALGLPIEAKVARQAKGGRWCVEVDRKLVSVTDVVVKRAPMRPGLRHEAASALAMWCRYRTAERLPFSALAVYLTACHHGKVRTSLAARQKSGLDVAGLFAAKEKDAGFELEGETWTLDFDVADAGMGGRFTERGFEPSTVGWSGLVAELLGGAYGQAAPIGALRPDDDPSLANLGPFRLAYLEALVRAADVAASRLPPQEHGDA